MESMKKPVTLEEWLFENKISKTQFAKMTGYSRPYLHNVLSGRHRVCAKFQKIAEFVTQCPLIIEKNKKK